MMSRHVILALKIVKVHVHLLSENYKKKTFRMHKYAVE